MIYKTNFWKCQKVEVSKTMCFTEYKSRTDKLNKEYSWKVIDDYCFSKYSENCLLVILLKFIGTNNFYALKWNS